MTMGGVRRVDKKIYIIVIQYIKCKVRIHYFLVLRFFVNILFNVLTNEAIEQWCLDVVEDRYIYHYP